MSIKIESTCPDISRYKNGDYSEDEFYYAQYCGGIQFIRGAAAILEGNGANCNECATANDLIAAFLGVMESAEQKVQKTKRTPIPQITIDELKKKIGKVGQANIKIIINADGYLALEDNLFTIGEGRRIWDRMKKAAPAKKNGKAA